MTWHMTHRTRRRQHSGVCWLVMWTAREREGKDAQRPDFWLALACSACRLSLRHCHLFFLKFFVLFALCFSLLSLVSDDPTLATYKPTHTRAQPNNTQHPPPMPTATATETLKTKYY